MDLNRFSHFKETNTEDFLKANWLWNYFTNYDSWSSYYESNLIHLNGDQTKGTYAWNWILNPLATLHTTATTTNEEWPQTNFRNQSANENNLNSCQRLLDLDLHQNYQPKVLIKFCHNLNFLRESGLPSQAISLVLVPIRRRRGWWW